MLSSGEGDVKRINFDKFLITIVLFVCCSASPLWAGELRPFVLPNSNQQAQTEQYRSARQTAPRPPSVYQQFEDDVRKMAPNEREKMCRYYEKLREQARRSGDQVQVNYYDTLLAILAKYL